MERRGERAHLLDLLLADQSTSRVSHGGSAARSPGARRERVRQVGGDGSGPTPRHHHVEDAVALDLACQSRGEPIGSGASWSAVRRRASAASMRTRSSSVRSRVGERAHLDVERVRTSRRFGRPRARCGRGSVSTSRGAPRISSRTSERALRCRDGGPDRRSDSRRAASSPSARPTVDRLGTFGLVSIRQHRACGGAASPPRAPPVTVRRSRSCTTRLPAVCRPGLPLPFAHDSVSRHGSDYRRSTRLDRVPAPAARWFGRCRFRPGDQPPSSSRR